MKPIKLFIVGLVFATVLFSCEKDTFFERNSNGHLFHFYKWSAPEKKFFTLDNDFKLNQVRTRSGQKFLYHTPDMHLSL